MKNVFTTFTASLLFAATFATGAEAEYPEKPINMIGIFGAGGSGDTTMRALADYAQRTTGATIVVENITGGGGTIGASSISRADPDGYTIGLVSTSPYTVTPYFNSVTYDPLTDFTYIGQYTVSPAPVIVLADSPFQTIDDLMAFGKENPGKLRWATGAPLGTNHISTESALRQNGVQGQFVPFKGSAEALTSLLSGDLEFVVATSFGPALANGQVRLLAESGPNKIDGHPDLPTYEELGYNLTLPIFLGIAGPAGMPEEAVTFWEEVMLGASTDPVFIEVLNKYLTPSIFMGSAEFTERVHSGYTNTGTALEELGLLDN